MGDTFHYLHDLFRQLGLNSSSEGIDQFIENHSPLESSILLAEASVWTINQSDFLKEELLKDADWVESIDLLNIELRKSFH
jgi:hypothetical protein